MMPATACKTLLVIEDNMLARSSLTILLSEAGYKVLMLANGQEGLDYLRSGPPPDLIMLDMLMPVLDGWKFLEELRSWSKPLHIPIVVTTGTILSRQWAADHGCAGFLHKPFNPEELMEEIQRCLSLFAN